MDWKDSNRVSSRARPRKPHEPDPFLSLDIIRSPVAHILDTPKPKRVTGSMVDRLSIGNSSNRKQSEKVLSRNTPIDNYSSLDSSRKIIDFVKPSAVLNENNNHVKKPFKHAVDNCQIVSKAKDSIPVDPSVNLADETALAAFQVQQILGRPKTPLRPTVPGRLQKGRLRPPNPVTVHGPTIYQCRGIVADRRLGKASEKVERRGYLVASLQHNPGLLTGGDGISSLDALDRTESLHQPSEASSDAGDETTRLRLLVEELGQSEVSTGLGYEDETMTHDMEMERGPNSRSILHNVASRPMSYHNDQVRPVTQPRPSQYGDAPANVNERPSTVGERPKSVHFATSDEVFNLSARGTADVTDQSQAPPKVDGNNLEVGGGEGSAGHTPSGSSYIRDGGTISSISSSFSNLQQPQDMGAEELTPEQTEQNL